MIRFIFLLTILASFTSSAFAQKIWVWNEKMPFVPQGEYLEYCIDSTAQMDFEKIQRLSFVSNPKKILNLGKNNYPVWLRFRLKNETIEKLWLELSYNNYGKVFLYEPDSQGRYRKLLQGQEIPFSQKAFPSASFIFPLTSLKDSTQLYYLYYADCPTEIIAPIRIGKDADFVAFEHQQDTILGICLGAMLIMFFYNLFIYLSTHEKSYLYYIGNMLAIIFANLVLTGYGFEWFWQETPEANRYSVFFLGLSAVSICLYIYLFLEVWKISKMAFWTGNFLLLMFGVGTLLSIFDQRVGLSWVLTFSLFEFWYCMFYSFKKYRQGFRPALYLTFAQLFRWAGIAILVITLDSVLDYTLFTRNALTIGSTLEVAFFALALASRINLYKEERQKAQAEALKQSEENARLVSNQNQILEQKVSERTQELSIKNEEVLTQTEELQQQHEELLSANEQLQEQHTLLRLAHFDITSSITYAKRIQDTILPNHQDIKRNLGEYFILFKPRDVVSGDFYWLAEVQQKSLIPTEAGMLSQKISTKTVFIVADCTGHGVPGAFMSLLGESLLDQIVNQRQVSSPNLILSNLNLALRQQLKQKESNNRDGMDLAVCVIDKETRTVEFAAAKRPLIYFKNNELHEINGDDLSIGGSEIAQQKENKFTKHTINIDVQTVFYLFSDGYVDQFGGKDNKKFLIKNFRPLLQKIHTLSMEEQGKILEATLKNWKGKEKQIDDILVAGFRIG